MTHLIRFMRVFSRYTSKKKTPPTTPPQVHPKFQPSHPMMATNTQAMQQIPSPPRSIPNAPFPGIKSSPPPAWLLIFSLPPPLPNRRRHLAPLCKQQPTNITKRQRPSRPHPPTRTLGRAALGAPATVLTSLGPLRQCQLPPSLLGRCGRKHTLLLFLAARFSHRPPAARLARPCSRWLWLLMSPTACSTVHDSCVMESMSISLGRRRSADGPPDW